jgi:uncharacterized phage protein (TIGR01671 family)
MREIKFRAWDKEADEMVLWEDDYFASDMEIDTRLDRIKCHIYNAGEGPDYTTEYHDAILMQYTGLKDKNGTEIYEGDEVAGQITGGNGHYERGVIDWSDKKAGFVLRFDNGGWRNLAGCHNKEVIGNIHENKELLDG